MKLNREAVRFKRLKDATCFRMQALETALVETQLLLKREREVFNMTTCDHESKIANQEVKMNEMDKFI